MNKNYYLYERAKKLIPGGVQLFSKKPEIYLPNGWPVYYKSASGVNVWDLDDRKYIDMGGNGIASCVLGYADPDVNSAVIRAVHMGGMAQLNCPEEVELAELLCNLHPWAQMVRFT